MSHLASRPGVALFVGLTLALAAAPRSGAAVEAGQGVHARKVSLAPLFDTSTRFKKKKTVKLRFRAKDRAAGAKVTLDDISFSLRRGMENKTVPLQTREVRDGVFEVPFTPEGPGQYWVIAAIRGVPAASLPPVRLGVLGVADGLIEVPPEADVDVKRNKKMSSKAR
jgi:hypothetical protein